VKNGVFLGHWVRRHRSTSVPRQPQRKQGCGCKDATVQQSRDEMRTAGGTVDGHDRALPLWFLSAAERGNPHTDARAFTVGNLVRPLIDGRTYFRELHERLLRIGAGDAAFFFDFRGDAEERLDGPGSEIGALLAACARRGAAVFGLLWRSQPEAVNQSEEKNAEFARDVNEHGGAVLLDARTRRGGSHHQKLVVLRHGNEPDADVAFVGGIDLSLGRGDTRDHHGDPQALPFPEIYGPRPPWHDIQAMVRGPAVDDLEHCFRERWYGNSVLDVPSPFRQLYDRAYHAGITANVELPPPSQSSERVGTHAVQVLRTYPARWRRYPFAPHGERSIAHAYRKAFSRARRIIYIEDQYFWSMEAVHLLARALRQNPDLRVVAVVPRHPDIDGVIAGVPPLYGRWRAMAACQRAGGDRFCAFDIENDAGTPIYVHAKTVIIDDVWAIIGSDNLNRRSWTHDSELSIAVLDAEEDGREPRDPAGLGDQARAFARNLRLDLLSEHLERPADELPVDVHDGIDLMRASADALERWYASGQAGTRPAGRLRPHRPGRLPWWQRLWARPVFDLAFDPDGRAIRDRLRRIP
jgi:phosphatidylserine/phosphatidylglycerophosphate/cardiolipin synthase-like enzyme